MFQLLAHLPLFLLQSGLTWRDLLIISLLLGLIVIAFLYFLRCLSILILVSFEKQFQTGHFGIWLNVVEKVSAPIIIVNGLFYGALLIPWSERILSLLLFLYALISLIFFVDVLRAFIVDAVKIYFKAKGTAPEAIKTVVNFTKVMCTIILWLIAVLIILQLARVDAQALLGGLGIASVIVAFSFQNILKDIFAFFSIYVDRSFSVGDYVSFDNFEGTIKEIRMRTTKIQGLKGHEIIISNNQIVNGVIENFRSLKRRRVAINLKVCSTTKLKQLKPAIAAIKKIFAEAELNQRLELSSVSVDDITEHGINVYIIYRFIYHPGDSNYYQHLAYKEKVLLAIKKVFEEKKIELFTPYGSITC